MISLLRGGTLVGRGRVCHQGQLMLSRWPLYSSSSSAMKLQESVGVGSDDDCASKESNYGTSFSKEGSSWLDKVVYSSYMEKFIPPPGYRERLKERFEIKNMEREELIGKTGIMPPVAVKYLLNSLEDSYKEVKGDAGQHVKDGEEGEMVQFPFKVLSKMEFIEEKEDNNVLEENEGNDAGKQKAVKLESVAERLRRQEIDPESVIDDGPYKLSDVFEAAAEVCISDAGTPDPTCPPSRVPCGGCGAILHCQDQSVPGYISSEKFKKAKKADLMADVCYRCSVLESHQATLNVNVSSEDYPRIVGKIREKYAMVLLIVDITDFPCSIWPEILEIIGSRRPILLIGNKVDLLPQDSPEFLKRVEESMIKCAVEVGLLDANIIHTALVSAKTGFGVERLISSIFNLCKGKGDIFIMGCTNVGKSSLFNLFLQSDLCKPQVSELVQKATISQWPGTTLNLLKFPFNSPSGWKKYLRQKRLETERPLNEAEAKERIMQLKMTRNPEHAVLTGHVGKTFESPHTESAISNAVTTKDIFHVNTRSTKPPPTQRPGQWNPDDPMYNMDRWVYDTPGAVNSNQILDLLTLPELMQSLPKEMIQPRTYFIKPSMSFFIGGLARIDFENGPHPIRYTLFSNSSLPVTMSLIQDADMIYEKALGTNVFAVPSGGAERLSQFPALESKPVELEGCGHTYSCADLVLSSIGWVAVTAGHGQKFSLSVYTPNGKGIFIRRPAMLPYAVNYKGKRIRGTYSYLPHQVYVNPRGNRNKNSNL